MSLSGCGPHWLGKYVNKTKTKNKNPTNKPAKQKSSNTDLNRSSLVATSEVHLVPHYPLLCLRLAIHSFPLYVGHVVDLLSCTFPSEHPVTSTGFLRSLQIRNNNAAALGLSSSTRKCPGVHGSQSRARKAPPAAQDSVRDFPR